jgi:hypothetical protein
MNQGRLLTRLVVLLLFVGSITSSIHAQGTNRMLYGAIGNFLVRIDPLTGKATEVAPFAFPAEITSVISFAFDESTEILYGLGGNPGGVGPLRFWRTLVRIDSCKRNCIFCRRSRHRPIGGMYVSISINGDVPDGDFFSETLATVNPTSAVATVVGTITGTVHQEADGLEFVGSTLSAMDDPGQGPTSIYTINPASAATFVGTTSSPRFNHVGRHGLQP